VVKAQVDLQMYLIKRIYFQSFRKTPPDTDTHQYISAKTNRLERC